MIVWSAHSRLFVLSRIQSGTRVENTNWSTSSNDGANKKRKQTLPSLFVIKEENIPVATVLKLHVILGTYVL